MSDKKNLDRLFQEKLQDFEQAPRPDVWGQIQGRMQEKKKRRIAVWWWYGAAAILLLSLFVFWPEDPAAEEILTQPIITSTPETEDNSNNPVEKNEEKELFKNPDPIQEDRILITETPSKENTSPTNVITPQKRSSKNSISTEAIAENIINEKKVVNDLDLNVLQEQEKKSITKDVSIANFKDNQKQVVELKLPVEKKVDSTKKKLVEPKKDFFAAVDEEITEEKEPKKKKWSLRPLVAFSTLANSSSSPSGPTFRNNSTSGNSSMNYGISVAYELNDRLTLQTGVMTQNMNFNTQDVVVIQQPNVFSPASAISLRSGVSYIVSGSSSLVTVGNSSANIAIADSNAELNQVIRYVEIPVEAKYRVTSSKKIRSYLIGGFSSLFLQNNDVILESDVVGRTNIGTATNLNSVNFSGNIGLDFDYQISQNLFLNLNPMFKVHLNTFSRNSNGYQPYFMGVYSGIKYRF